MVTKDKYLVLNSLDIILLPPYQNEIATQLFVHTSERLFRQSMTKNVRILEHSAWKLYFTKLGD